MNDLDTKIRRLLNDVDRATPKPPSFDELRSGTVEPGSEGSRRRLVAGAAAAAVVALGVAGMTTIGRDDAAPSGPADQPATEIPNAETTVAETIPATTTLDTVVPLDDAPANGESLFTTPLDAAQVPVVILEGAATTYAHSQRYPAPFEGGFEGSTVLVPDGASFDMPRIAIDVVERTAANGNLELDVAGNAEQIDVAGTTGYLTTEQTDFESGADGPLHLLFVELDADRYVRVNAVGVGVEEMVSIVDTYDPASGTVTVPDGYRTLDMPDHDINQTVEFRYDIGGGVEADLQASSRGAEFLLGDLGHSVTSTELIDGIEVVVRTDADEQPARVTAYWIQGDWAFRASVSGFDDPATIADVLAGFRLVDDATFTANFDAADVVTDSTRAADVAAMITDVEFPPELAGLDLTDRRGANVRYQEIAAVSGTIACSLLDVYFDNIDQNPATAQQAADALAGSTDWDMLLEIEDQGGWSSAVWDTAAAIGGNGVAPATTIPGGEPPSQQNIYPGLGCDTR
jgi:hypothetical protein